MDRETAAVPSAAKPMPSSLREYLLYFLRLGTFDFGGPIPLAGHTQKDLVEKRQWVSSQNYIDGLAFIRR